MKRNRGLYDNLEVGCVRDSIYILFFDILWPFRRMSCSFLSFKVNLTSFRESQKLRIAWLAKLSKFHFCSITYKSKSLKKNVLLKRFFAYYLRSCMILQICALQYRSTIFENQVGC
eukprot:GHVP01045290.1.p1 GENE.GHVP01045290.1~~GHVP01045290.1.p1  ORF type:complete len:116 (+),score=2.51 GHVP01045290.1:395-742(+)